ncbi:DUF7305 domain-containing protein [Natronogracilivirga saccharolytica]|uniref:DUF7305 domain-containing protein n=1 Tax=Natronogracilivirga saccharolytica TaxID=2812953 RepID=A0A8J7UUV2_9BACT|nr:hypothetical protein [Natronogracilivirga saccharolytica]MBP3191912.1 hypothetical protein [Natronogracilivirga saccharolytica]
MGKYAMILVSALVFSMTVYANSLINTNLAANTRTVESYSHNQAQNIAQSAIMAAIRQLQQDESSPLLPASDQSISFPSETGFEPWDALHGDYRLHFRNQSDTLLVIESTGRFEEKSYKVSAGLTFGQSGWNPVFNQAVHGEHSIDLTGSSSIKGSASINSTEPVSVTLDWATVIENALSIGPGGDPAVVVDKRHEGNIGEGIFNLPREQTYPMPDFPSYPPKMFFGSSVYLQGNDTKTLMYNDFDGYYIPEIRVRSNTSLTIDLGDEDRVLHVGNFDIQNGHVHLEGDGSLEVYVENKLNLGASSTVNSDGDVGRFFLYYGGNDAVNFRGDTNFNGGLFAKSANVELGGSNSLTGSLITGGTSVDIRGAASAESRVVYAPNAHVELRGSASIHGAVISDSFRAVGNSHVYYEEDLDSELPDLDTGGEGSVELAYWE